MSNLLLQCMNKSPSKSISLTTKCLQMLNKNRAYTQKVSFFPFATRLSFRKKRKAKNGRGKRGARVLQKGCGTFKFPQRSSCFF